MTPATCRTFAVHSGQSANFRRVAPGVPPQRGLAQLRRVAGMIAFGFGFLSGALTGYGVDSVRGLPFSRSYSLEDVGYVPRGSRLNFDVFGRVAVIHEGVYAVLNDTVWSNLSEPNDPAHYPINEVVQTDRGDSYYGGRASWGVVARTESFMPDRSCRPIHPPGPGRRRSTK
jgi:hypothetical protein